MCDHIVSKYHQLSIEDKFLLRIMVTTDLILCRYHEGIYECIEHLDVYKPVLELFNSRRGDNLYYLTEDVSIYSVDQVLAFITEPFKHEVYKNLYRIGQ